MADPSPSPGSANADAEAGASARVVDRNIHALLERRRRALQHSPPQARVAAAITRFTGSMASVYTHLIAFVGWAVLTTGLVPSLAVQESWVILATFASAEAIFLTTFVLINQNRMEQVADDRADLDLQISLLAEHEITRLVQLVSEIAKRLQIEAGGAPDLEELKRDVRPEQVLDRMEAVKRDLHD